VHITPVNYGVDQPLLFRTAEGTKLLGGKGHAVGLRGRRGHRRLRPQRRRGGTARRLPDDQVERAELTSWIASPPKYDVVEIIPRR